MSSSNPFAPPTAEVADVSVLEQSPPLWNPNAAAAWSLVFSPIFGAILHMKNWQALGQPEKAAICKNWAIGVVGFIVFLVLFSLFLPESKALDALSRFGGIGILVAWYYNIGKSQQAFVLARYGKTYARKGWAKPICLAVLVFLGFIVAAGIVIAVLGGFVAQG